MSLWDNLVEEALAKLESLKHLLPLRTIHLPNPNDQQQEKAIETETQSSSKSHNEEQGIHGCHVFNEIQPWDRCSVEVLVTEVMFHRLINFLPSTGTHASFFSLQFLFLFAFCKKFECAMPVWTMNLIKFVFFYASNNKGEFLIPPKRLINYCVIVPL